MAQSNEIKTQIDTLLGQINPMLEQLPGAEDYYKKRVNEAYNYNLGPLTNAANIEAKMYSLPGTLMSQYDQEFGGKTGVSAMQRINSILGQLGQQGALANTAWGLADQSKTRINDLANSLYNQYKASIEAYQQKLAPLLSIWERMYSEENANKRAQMSRGGSSYGGTRRRRQLQRRPGGGQSLRISVRADPGRQQNLPGPLAVQQQPRRRPTPPYRAVKAPPAAGGREREL